MKKIINLLAIFALLSFYACAPRGENQSVDQVFANQKNNYQSQLAAASVKADIGQGLDRLTQVLEKITRQSEQKEISASANELSEDLSNLILNAGYTSRPALTELVNQYTALSQASGIINTSAVKLLAARTYSALAAELETTKFNL